MRDERTSQTRLCGFAPTSVGGGEQEAALLVVGVHRVFVQVLEPAVLVHRLVRGDKPAQAVVHGVGHLPGFDARVRVGSGSFGPGGALPRGVVRDVVVGDGGFQVRGVGAPIGLEGFGGHAAPRIVREGLGLRIGFDRGTRGFPDAAVHLGHLAGGVIGEAAVFRGLRVAAFGRDVLLESPAQGVKHRGLGFGFRVTGTKFLGNFEGGLAFLGDKLVPLVVASPAFPAFTHVDHLGPGFHLHAFDRVPLFYEPLLFFEGVGFGVEGQGFFIFSISVPSHGVVFGLGIHQPAPLVVPAGGGVRADADPGESQGLEEALRLALTLTLSRPTGRGDSKKRLLRFARNDRKREGALTDQVLELGQSFGIVQFALRVVHGQTLGRAHLAQAVEGGVLVPREAGLAVFIRDPLQEGHGLALVVVFGGSEPEGAGPAVFGHGFDVINEVPQGVVPHVVHVREAFLAEGDIRVQGGLGEAGGHGHHPVKGVVSDAGDVLHGQQAAVLGGAGVRGLAAKGVVGNVRKGFVRDFVQAVASV